jgi:serine phosphatase RsbU (regulator of sigma subunit)
VAIVLNQAGLTKLPRILERPLPLPPFTMQTGVFLHIFFLLAMLVFLIRRFALARGQEEKIAQEREAGRQIQLILLPDQLDQSRYFMVECAYFPAEQVGGDFFQQIADDDGGMTIVIGDVSGKGLMAATMVSLLVGAIRAEASHGANPATLLASLNERMMGRSRGGFTTCLAARFSSSGLMTLANAGHLPPYLNGNEVDLPGALPLGILEGAEYETTTIQLAPGDCITFMTDGVPEAQTKAGELFGFERTREVSTQPADRIAEAACTFGQSDDVTVVTAEFMGAEAAAAV